MHTHTHTYPHTHIHTHPVGAFVKPGWWRGDTAAMGTPLLWRHCRDTVTMENLLLWRHCWDTVAVKTLLGYCLNGDTAAMGTLHFSKRPRSCPQNRIHCSPPPLFILSSFPCPSILSTIVKPTGADKGHNIWLFHSPVCSRVMSV